MAFNVLWYFFHLIGERETERERDRQTDRARKGERALPISAEGRLKKDQPKNEKKKTMKKEKLKRGKTKTKKLNQEQSKAANYQKAIHVSEKRKP